MVKHEDLPYRPCVGVLLFNADGKVWIGHRIQKPKDAEASGIGMWWQMPQGGVDEGEDLSDAAMRELTEETGVTSAEIIEEAPDWFYYDLPPHLLGVSWKGRYRGQKQRWFAMRFTGDESEIDISGIGHKAEFKDWRWADLNELPELIVPFKRQVYEQLVAAFAHLGR